MRQPQTPLGVVRRIQALREQYPRWGREKQRVLLDAEGGAIAAKSIDRESARLKARGAWRKPPRPRRQARWHHERPRRPQELQGERPGDLVQVDSKQVSLGKGVVYEFGAVDCFTRPSEEGWPWLRGSPAPKGLPSSSDW